MPIHNRFQHQIYSAERPQAPYEIIAPSPPSDWNAARTKAAFEALAGVLANRKTQVVYLVHGTFTGTDALGFIREFERWKPDIGKKLRDAQKMLIDKITGEAGNYSESYAKSFQDALNHGSSNHDSSSTPTVKLFHWTSENLHLARANAAVRLLDELHEDTHHEQRRYLMWGHSHAGNVFALLTNLIGSDVRTLKKFFKIGDAWRRFRLLGHLDPPVWKRVRGRVLENPEILKRIELDIVTFGTPIRYGWETSSYRSLSHFVYHRPQASKPEYLAPFPEGLSDVLEARYGDCVQQLGIAGTNFTPFLFAWRSWIVEERFRRFLQRGISRLNTLDRLRIGQRVANEGKALLVDYDVDGTMTAQQLFGHAIYTRTEWLPFHMQKVATELAEQES